MSSSATSRTMTTDLATYFADGCGRCPLFATDACKVRLWGPELSALRQVLQETDLAEGMKWGTPCYTFSGHNVALLYAFKSHCAVLFFKGALLEDVFGWLEKPGENTQIGRLIRFTDLPQVAKKAAGLKHYVAAAIALEQAENAAVLRETPATPIPPEFEAYCAAHPTVKTAFESLTPGRRRGYLLHFLAAKQPDTRRARIARWSAHILEGKGMRDA